MLHAVIFDFDGVLFDSEHIHYQAYCKIFEQYGFSIPYEAYTQAYLGLQDDVILKQIFAKQGQILTPAQIQQLVAKKVQHYQNEIKQKNSLSSTKGLAQFLAQAIQFTEKLAICTNCKRIELDAVLAKLENGQLRRYFQTITTVDEVEIGKPAPDSYLKTAAKLQLKPQQCLVIEDSINGIKAAKAAGMTVAGLVSTHKPEDLSQADFVVHQFLDIDLTSLLAQSN
jgi:beta-phosphoglucomutase